MRGKVPLRVLAFLGCMAAGGIGLAPSGQAQDSAQPAPAGTELQVEDSPFAEEIKQLEAAADKAGRRAAFAAVLTKATELKASPDPLVSILRNKKPAEAFTDLVEYVRETPEARHVDFLQPLILAANEPGEGARSASAAVVAYRMGAVDTICTMLKSESKPDRLAAAGISAERVGGMKGGAKLTIALVNALASADAELSTVCMRSLARITLLKHEKAEDWRAWLGDKSELDLIAEIGDREAEERRKSEEERKRIEKALLQKILDDMKADDSQNASALVGHLKTSPYLDVRLKACELLAALLPKLAEDAAREPIDILGERLLLATEHEDVRKAAAAALAGSGKPALSFPYIDRCLEGNGISANLRLELVRGLNAPIAATRLALLLKSELDGAELRGGAVLETLLTQARNVLEFQDASQARRDILEQFSRLHLLVLEKVAVTTDTSARSRLLELATRACDTIVFLARVKSVDVSATAEALLSLGCSDTTAAGAAITAMREALRVPESHAALVDKLGTPPESDRLAALYTRLLAGTDEAMQINVMGLYEALSLAPEDLAVLRKRLLDRARSSEATIPRGNERKTIRDALRALLAKLYTSAAEHTSLLNELLGCQHGDKDFIAYVQLLSAPRVALIAATLQPLLEKEPVRVALLIEELHGRITNEEHQDRDYKSLRTSVDASVRAHIARVIGETLSQGMTDARRAELPKLAAQPMRRQFIDAALEQLKTKPAPGEARDEVSEVLLQALRGAHPERYDGVALKGLSQEEFTKAIEQLHPKLKEDGYNVP